MITLITGGPGTGKTCFTVAELLDEKYKGRPLYVDGVTDLQIPHETFDPENWPTEVPDGALVVVDECQRYWRPAGPGKTPPPSITEMETHRHRGIDFFLLTQHPSLVHQNIRRLVARHIHIVANWAGRKQYEWAECKTDPQSGRTTAVSKPYKLPKKAYALYKSAEIHTKQKRTIPAAVYIFVVAISLVAFLAFRVYGSISDKMGGEVAQQTDSGSSNGTLSSVQNNKIGSLDTAPRIPYIPESAPIYDSVRKVQTFPQVKACVYSEAKGCVCYTQQATRYLTTEAFCKTYVAQGRFDPYRDEEKDDRRDDQRLGNNAHDRRASGRVADGRPTDRGGMTTWRSEQPSQKVF